MRSILTVVKLPEPTPRNDLLVRSLEQRVSLWVEADVWSLDPPEDWPDSVECPTKLVDSRVVGEVVEKGRIRGPIRRRPRQEIGSGGVEPVCHKHGERSNPVARRPVERHPPADHTISHPRKRRSSLAYGSRCTTARLDGYGWVGSLGWVGVGFVHLLEQQ
jgi:hypothetical protein